MRTCPICMEDISEDEKYLFLGDNGQSWYICKTCEQKLYLVTNGRRKRWVHLAIEDLHEKMQHMDGELAAYLQTLIEQRERAAGMHIPYL